MLLLSGCLGGDSTATDDDTDIDDTPIDTSNPDLFEGDEAGECTDGADNDQNGLFDCNDPNCSGSPDCAAPDDNNTQPDDNNTQPDDNNTQPDDNNTQPDDNNTEPQLWQDVNLTEQMIQSGVLDSSECGILMLVNEWDITSKWDESAFRLAVLNTEPPAVDVWIATYENDAGDTILPSLYDWRNGVIDTDSSGRIYIFDSDEEISFWFEGIDNEYDLGLICLPSQRDAIMQLFETIDPRWANPAIPELWDHQVVEFRDTYENGTASLCEIVYLDVFFNPSENGYDLAKRHHNKQIQVIEELGVTEVNFWFANLSDSDSMERWLPSLDDWFVEVYGWVPDYYSGAIGHFVIIDNSGLHFPNVGDIGEFCDSNSREDVARFLVQMGYAPSELKDSIAIRGTNESLTPYDQVEIITSPWSIHLGMDLECDILENNTFPHTGHHWIFRGQIINEDILNISSFGAQVGDMVACVVDYTIYNSTFSIESSPWQITERGLLLYDGNITQTGGVADIIECDVSILNPNQDEYAILYYWAVDNDGDSEISYEGGDWWSNYSTNGTFNPNNPEPGNGFSSIQIEREQMIRCIVEMYTPADAQQMLDYGYDGTVAQRNLGVLNIDFWIQNSNPIIDSIELLSDNKKHTDNHQCSVQTSDVDNDSISIVYEWYVNGGPTTVKDQFFDGQAENLQSGDVLICVATADDGEGGTTNASASVTVT